jgi:predicted CoA-binding protein
MIMNDFFARFNRFAVLGLSRNPKSFSRNACVFLKAQGCDIYPVNPNTNDIDGQRCYGSIEYLPAVQAALFFTNPRVSERLLPLCKEKGIVEVWFQQGSADDTVIKVAEGLGITYKNSCVFLHHPKAGFPHNFHRSIIRILGMDK